MSKYSSLRAAITAAIYENNNESITGAVLQAKMIDIVNALDLGSLFLGVATAATAPSTEANGFYLALTGGTYANFLTSGGTEITVENREIAIIVPDGNAWRKIRILKLTSTVTENSEDVPDGGAVYNALAQKQPLLTAGDGITIDKDNVIHATVVEANPQGETPDADLDALKVGNKVYSIPQGGTSDYDELEHKPSINSQPLSGNMTSQQLGLQDRLVSGTTIKTINGQPVLGSGNLNTANGYIHADDESGMPEPSADYASKICLVPSTQNQGSLDQYACIENAVVEGRVVSGWSWVLIGTTAPIVSVQRVDTYQPMLPVKTVDSYVSKSGGGFSPSSTLETVIYDISDAKKLVCDFTVIAAGTLSLSFFDDGLDLNDLSTASSHYLGWRVDKNKSPYVVTENTQFENQIIDVNSDATLGSGDVTGAKYVGLSRLVSSHFGTVSVLTPVPQSLVKKQPTALNEILIFNTLIQLPQIWNNDTADDTEITTQQTLSTWGVVFPSTYTNTGKPTQIIAMLHGLSGYVANGVLGYSGYEWVASRQAYLDAGFAVMDVNGFGTGDSDDADSRPWGNPASVETLDKAFEYLKENYNVCEKLLIAGISMGAILAMSYAKSFPGKVSAVACFAPNLFAYSSRYVGSEITKATSWGYASLTDANTDGWKHTIGYVVLSAPMVIDSEGYVKKYEWPASKPSDWPENLDALQLVDYFPVPLRVWQGTADTDVNPNGSKLLVHSLRRGNSDATLRLCLGAYHDVQNEQYVRNEAVSWFKRFVD